MIEFDEQNAVCFKVETHNHPSAIEPYGGAATGIGGVIRDPMGTGLGAQPDRQHRHLLLRPAGHAARRRAQGRAAPAARDARRRGRRARLRQPHGHPHGQRRGVLRRQVPRQPAGLLRHASACCRATSASSRPHAGDAVVVRRRADRARRHPRRDLLLRRADARARDGVLRTPCRSATPSPKRRCSTRSSRPATRGLYTAITDCGAGGLSSAVGEMGEKLGAEVHLDRVPLKYAGLSLLDEIWISEAQERMVLSVPPENVERILQIFAAEDVEATVIGTFGTPDRKLRLLYGEHARRRAGHGVPARGPAPPDQGRRVATRSSAHRPPPRAAKRLQRRRCCRSSPRPTWPARNGSSASTTTRCRAAA